MDKDRSQAAIALQKYFGFPSFRPLQEEIITDILNGRDVLALLPTGGGKSLCFQLPALLLPGLTVVVSPLIALMKDQVDGLTAAGVPATFLNSSLKAEESRQRIQGLQKGAYRLLYLAPERLFSGSFLRELEQWKPILWAIDEAHCISEWGHDFRPDYRQLTQLHSAFPKLPILALTATATERVRHDICRLLQLRTPKHYVASFNRPNLAYRVETKRGGMSQLLTFLRPRTRESGIIYCQTRKKTEQLAAALQAEGIRAAAYHAGMEAQERSGIQERFLRDQVQVMCATIAFGMGINKPNVRYVVHYELPKNLEGYYQETGRAGRDGLPSDCLLLYGAGDAVKCERFIAMKPEPTDQEHARAQLRLMVQYAEGLSCRRRTLLGYFGEILPDTSCGNCDCCNDQRETWDATVPAQKMLSCVFRIRELSGFGMGLSHVTEVLTGASTQKIKDFGHDRLSTYGLGKDQARTEWAILGRELIRNGLLSQNAERFNILELTAAGMTFLKSRATLQLTRVAQPAAREPESSGWERRIRGASDSRTGGIECDEVLFEELRKLRMRLADERDVPAYIILSDVALRQIARQYPTSNEALLRISGIGEKKVRDFGGILTKAVSDHLSTHPRQPLTEDKPSAQPTRAASKGISPTISDSLEMFKGGASLEQIADRRGLAITTIMGHLASAVESGESIDTTSLFREGDSARIEAALKTHGNDNLAGVIETLGGQLHYGHLRIYIALKSLRANPQPLS